MRILYQILVLLFSSSAVADGWGTFSDYEKLKGQEIVDVGEIEKLSPPVNTKWNVDLYKVGLTCFSVGYLYNSWSNSKASLILVDKYKTPKLGIIESSIGSINVKIHDITVYECPGVKDYTDAMQEQIRQLELLQEKLKQYQR